MKKLKVTIHFKKVEGKPDSVSFYSDGGDAWSMLRNQISKFREQKKFIGRRIKGMSLRWSLNEKI